MNRKVFNSVNSNRISSGESKNKKFDFNQKKENTLKSLHDVENFLCDFRKFTNYIKLYKILK